MKKKNKSAIRFWVRALAVAPVLSLFVIAWLSCVNPLAPVCSSGNTYCSGSQKCCPNGYPYHCNAGSASGKCYQSIPTNPPCTTYDYCSGQ
ncbi:MAG TPA: hypothetical protein VLX68_14175 [Chitinivibrionales bacterium]|nr:hypothetical protein [Chitinivibrionales bacterium]